MTCQLHVVERHTSGLYTPSYSVFITYTLRIGNKSHFYMVVP